MCPAKPQSPRKQRPRRTPSPVQSHPNSNPPGRLHYHPFRAKSSQTRIQPPQKHQNSPQPFPRLLLTHSPTYMEDGGEQIPQAVVVTILAQHSPKTRSGMTTKTAQNSHPQKPTQINNKMHPRTAPEPSHNHKSHSPTKVSATCGCRLIKFVSQSLS